MWGHPVRSLSLDSCLRLPNFCASLVRLIRGRIPCRHASRRTRAAARRATELSLLRMQAGAIVVFTCLERAKAAVGAVEAALVDLIGRQVLGLHAVLAVFLVDRVVVSAHHVRVPRRGAHAK